MRWRVSLFVLLAGYTALVPARADKSYQERYLEIYLKINEAEQFEKKGDFRGALDDFKDCYSKLMKIQRENPDWEKALVVHRLADCSAKIQELGPKAAMQAPTELPPPTLPPTNLNANTASSGDTQTAPTEDVNQLRLELQAARDELGVTKQKLAEALSQVDSYRVQLEAVNAQLRDAKQAASADERMGQLMTENKALTDKLATAQKEIDSFKTNPKSKLALALAQLKNVQDQFDASQEANKALQTTTTTLKQQLDQAQQDLMAANAKLAASNAASPEYQTLKHENEIMRAILTRELQEQAHRDMAKRLFQEEYDNLKLKSKVLQEQVDILASPMTPPTNDEERAMLASLKVPAPDVNAPPNTFSAPGGGMVAGGDTNAPSSMAPSTSGTDTTASAPATTNTLVSATPTSPDTSTNSGVTIVSSGTSTPAPDASATNLASNPTPPSAPADTNTASATPPAADTNASSSMAAAPSIPPSTDSSTTNVATAAPPPSAPVNPPNTTDTPTITHIPTGTTQITDTHITNNPDTSTQTAATDPTAYAHQARLPDDMRETAQEAADLFKNQKYDDSAAKYQDIINKYPESLYAWSNLGVVRFQQGKYDEALKALQQAVKLSPTDAFSYSNLGIVYYQLNQYENAIDALNSAKALDPNDAKTHNYLGCACSQKGWQEVAEKEFHKAIDLDPNFGDAHFNLALVYATSKPPSLELARREYNRALELGIAKDPRLEKLLGTTSVPARQTETTSTP
jgi:tetratricopeptide (TPR) repeat protein